MAKIRVYELARKLNLSNKVLIDKLAKLNISVKSHMSVIEDKDKIFEKIKEPELEEESVSETRIKSTIIRRRRKVVKTSTPNELDQKKTSDSVDEPVSEQVAEADPEFISASDPQTGSGGESVDDKPKADEKQKADKPKKTEKKAEKPKEKSAQFVHKHSKKKKKSVTVVAKIIKLPDKIEKRIEPERKIPIHALDKKEKITDKSASQEVEEK